jgi:hypothetical protein
MASAAFQDIKHDIGVVSDHFTEQEKRALLLAVPQEERPMQVDQVG